MSAERAASEVDWLTPAARMPWPVQVPFRMRPNLERLDAEAPALLLRDGLAQWMAGVVSPRGMPSYVDFVHGITAALDHVRREHTGNVLLVSSGGPIATAVGHILGTPPETTIELNMRIRNSALTEFAFTPKRHMLLTYNTLPHLDHADYADWVTYA